MVKLVLVRHGQSQWNFENRFTGWVDSPLTEKGRDEAKRAGRFLKENKIPLERAYTSYLQRAIHTLWLILSECEQSWIPVVKHWRLNERHYGGLQGLNKSETKKTYGEDLFSQWRRSYDIPPPSASGPLQKEQMEDPRYQGIAKNLFPKTESLKQTLERVAPYWDKVILPEIEKVCQSGVSKNKTRNILIVAHGNSLRSLVKYLTDMSKDEIVRFEFATGVPLICELNKDNKITNMDWMSHGD